MAQTPAERRARRDASARARINPDTGKPFKNYNQLDTWQRNQSAKAKGFSSRATERVQRAKATRPIPQPATPRGSSTPEQDKAQRMPNSYRWYLRGRPSTEALAAKFNYALGPLPPMVDGDDRFTRRAERERILGMDESRNWTVWRNDYDAVYG